MEMDEKTDHEASRESTPALPESLIAGRQRRSTAGNRLAQLLLQEQPDDIDLLFEENDEPDDDFVGKEESDVDLGSSSDEEDKPQEQDELAGEKELEKEERAGRKKRKAAVAFPGQKELDKLVQRQQEVRNKRVTIQEPSQNRERSTQSPLSDEHIPRARKKSERISWIPTQEDLPSRQSSRKQTVANKQMIHERMKESNERRLKVIAAMNEASLKKKEQKVELTQEMRLARAKKVEEQNRKSLNKWQEAEEARLAAQRAKLAALHNRKIEGPVIRFYSGKAEFDANGRMIAIGKRNLIKDISSEKSKSDAPSATVESIKQELIANTQTSGDVAMEEAPPDPTQLLNGPAEAKEAEMTIEASEVGRVCEQQTTEAHVAAPPPAPEEDKGGVDNPSPQKISVAPPSDVDDDTQNQIAEQLQGDLDASMRPPAPQIASQVYIVLRNFKKEAVNTKEVQGKILFPHNQGPLQKPEKLLCVTTNLPARFQDPVTGLPYANLFGYKQIQRVKQGDLQWNNHLQCFFDSQEAAAGVPDGFYV